MVLITQLQFTSENVYRVHRMATRGENRFFSGQAVSVVIYVHEQDVGNYVDQRMGSHFSSMS